MSFLSNSVNTFQSPKDVSAKSTLFCCCKSKEEEISVEIIKPIEIIEVKEINKEEPQENIDPDNQSIKENSQIMSNMEAVNNDMEKNASKYFSNCENSILEETLFNDNNKAKTSELQIRLGMYTELNTFMLTVVDVFDIDRPNLSKTSMRTTVTTTIPPILTYSIHILVFPSQKVRFKTNERKGPDPYFDELFKIPKVNIDDAKTWKLRFRFYGILRNSSQEMLGEGYLSLETLDLNMRTQCKVALMKYDPNISETMLSTIVTTCQCNYKQIVTSVITHKDQRTPKVLISLSYNFTIGRLTMEIIKGVNFPKIKNNKEPDSLVNITVLSKGREQITSLNTQIKKASTNPMFEENFILKIHFSRLEEITLKVSGCSFSEGKNFNFGSFYMGNSNSTNDEKKQWNDLFNSRCCDQVLLWHKLISDNVESVDGNSNSAVIAIIDEENLELEKAVPAAETTWESQEEIIPVEIEEIKEEPDQEQEGSAVDNEEGDIISDGEPNVVAAVGVGVAEQKKTSELRLRLVYDTETNSLLLTVVDAYDLARPSSSMTSIREHITIDVPAVLAYSVHVLVLPLKKLRFKTKMRQGPDPYFDEVIKIPKIKYDDVKTWTFRFRLYGSMRTSMKQVLGEGFLVLESLNVEVKHQYQIALMNYDPSVREDIENRIISASKWKQDSLTSLETIDRLTSLIEVGAGPEVLIGLSYNSNTGRLTMDIIKGNKFPKLKGNKQPDTLVNVILTSGKGDEMAHSKTVIQRCSCEPVFEEKFIFQILLFQLEDVKLTISGCHKKSLGKISAFGHFEMGNSNSTEEELNHWKDMSTSPCGEQVLRWHSFQPLEKK